MATLTRKTQFLFGSTAADIGQFGSGQLGTKVISDDPAVLQNASSGAAWAGGWLLATLGANKFPPLEEMNCMDYIETYQLVYLFQEGIPEYDGATTYSATGIVKQPGTLNIYASQAANNIGNALTNPSFWKSCGSITNLGANARISLTGATNYYVSTSGSDSNPGTIGSPWLTLQHAANYVLNNIDSGGNPVTIICSNGTYNVGAIFNGSMVGGGTLTLQGDIVTAFPSAPLAVIAATSQDCVATPNGGNIVVTGFSCQTTTQGNGLNADGGKIVASGNMHYANMGGQGSDLTANNLGVLQVNSSFTTTGNKASTFDAHALGALSVGPGVTCELVGTPVYSGTFASVEKVGFAELSGITYVGGGTGTQYNIIGNSLVSTNGATTNWPTGLTGGATSAGGQII